MPAPAQRREVDHQPPGRTFRPRVGRSDKEGTSWLSNVQTSLWRWHAARYAHTFASAGRAADSFASACKTTLSSSSGWKLQFPAGGAGAQYLFERNARKVSALKDSTPASRKNYPQANTSDAGVSGATPEHCSGEYTRSPDRSRLSVSVFGKSSSVLRPRTGHTKIETFTTAEGWNRCSMKMVSRFPNRDESTLPRAPPRPLHKPCNMMDTARADREELHAPAGPRSVWPPATPSRISNHLVAQSH